MQPAGVQGAKPPGVLEGELGDVFSGWKPSTSLAGVDGADDGGFVDVGRGGGTGRGCRGWRGSALMRGGRCRGLPAGWRRRGVAIFSEWRPVFLAGADLGVDIDLGGGVVADEDDGEEPGTMPFSARDWVFSRHSPRTSEAIFFPSMRCMGFFLSFKFQGSSFKWQADGGEIVFLTTDGLGSTRIFGEAFAVAGAGGGLGEGGGLADGRAGGRRGGWHEPVAWLLVFFGLCGAWGWFGVRVGWPPALRGMGLAPWGRGGRERQGFPGRRRPPPASRSLRKAGASSRTPYGLPPAGGGWGG